MYLITRIRNTFLCEQFIGIHCSGAAGATLRLPFATSRALEFIALGPLGGYLGATQRLSPTVGDYSGSLQWEPTVGAYSGGLQAGLPLSESGNQIHARTPSVGAYNGSLQW